MSERNGTMLSWALLITGILVLGIGLHVGVLDARSRVPSPGL